ncbi:MAG: YgjV family protein [Sphaerochaetaceae bacterium]|jgi:hypothetical protein|nr:YgjV family protein [Sphaerochaetaceae bacterium]MDD4219322.1 YgjV family protein [Sphaerochaetaceae bacterium]
MAGLIAQFLGILALLCMVLSYQQKVRVGLLKMQMLSNGLFVVSYFMLGAVSMAVMCLINVARSFVFIKNDTKWGKSPLWLYFFLGISLIGGIISWEGPISLLVIIATLILTVALYSKNLKFMRRMFLFPPLLYLSYNLLNKSIGGVGSDVFCLISAMIAIWRFDIKKPVKEKNTEEELLQETE